MHALLALAIAVAIADFGLSAGRVVDGRHDRLFQLQAEDTFQVCVVILILNPAMIVLTLRRAFRGSAASQLI
jgi:hypothetical protein